MVKIYRNAYGLFIKRKKNQLEQVQICSKLEIILTFSRKCLFYRIFTLPNFTLHQLLVQTPLHFAVNFSQQDWFLQMLQLANCSKNAPTYCFMTSYLFFFLDIFFPELIVLGGQGARSRTCT